MNANQDHAPRWAHKLILASTGSGETVILLTDGAGMVMQQCAFGDWDDSEFLSPDGKWTGADMRGLDMDDVPAPYAFDRNDGDIDIHGVQSLAGPNHSRKIDNARQALGLGPAAVRHLTGRLPADLIAQLTGRQLARVMEALNAAYLDGYAAAGGNTCDPVHHSNDNGRALVERARATGL